MEDRALRNLDYDLFFRLVRNLTPVSVQSGLYGVAGQVISKSANDLPDSIEDLTTWGKTRLVTEVPRRIEKTTREKQGCLYTTPILGIAGEVVGTFAVTTDTPFDTSAGSQDTPVTQALDTAVSLIEKPVQLETELDAMAMEMIRRYEELNLIYHSDDEIRDVDHDGKALKQLIEHCVEHLNISFVALSIPRQDQIFCAVNELETIPDAYELVRSVQEILLTRLQIECDSIIVNDTEDPLRKELDIPYKIMCIPIVDSLGDTFGMIACFNKLTMSDFFNSDRSLLKVVGRKVAKIIQTNYDELTGIYNRRAFQSIVEKALTNANERGISHCLLNINLDQLKVINDAMGRDAGDWVIQRTAIILQSKLRESDSIGYFGDAKYGILLGQCNLDNGASVAEELRSSIQESDFKWNGKRIDVSVTVGVALIEQNTKSADDALEASEIALESARLSGRNQVRVFSHDDEYIIARKTQMHWANYVQTALREDHFRIYAQTIQPILPNGERFHFEILIRLVDAKGKLVFPDSFIPPAENFNLMPVLDRWVINATFECLARNGFAQSKDEGVVSINLSGQSIANDELACFIAEKLQHHNIDPSCICFEITETAAIDDFSTALRVLNQIKQSGCHLSLDDFGTGLSSFSYLQTLPVDYVKIDGSFVKKLLEDDVSHAMVTSINHISHVMGLKTIAEYVENNMILAELDKLGIDYVQGYAIAKPVPIIECLQAIDQQSSTTAGQQAP